MPPSSWREVLYPPNLLSLARVALTPLAVQAILHYDYEQALGVCAVAGVTDALDGMVARRFGWSTRVGALLDPVADKIFAAAVFLSLGFAELLPWWLVGIVFGRDLLILCFSGVAIVFTARREFQPSVWGKISTAVQLVTALAALAAGVASYEAARAVVSGLTWLAAVATLWSGFDYARKGWRMLREIPRRGPQTPD